MLDTTSPHFHFDSEAAQRRHVILIRKRLAQSTGQVNDCRHRLRQIAIAISTSHADGERVEYLTDLAATLRREMATAEADIQRIEVALAGLAARPGL